MLTRRPTIASAVLAVVFAAAPAGAGLAKDKLKVIASFSILGDS